MLPAPVRLPASALAALVERERFGELHPTLASAPVWRDTAPATNDVTAQLTKLGWRGRDGRLDREVAVSLALLCRQDVAYYGWFTHDGTTTAVLAAGAGREGILAVRRQDGMIELSGAQSRRLVERLIAELPQTRPASGAPVVVSLSELRATDRHGRQRAEGGVVAHRARPEIRQVQELLRLPTVGAGELYSSHRPQPLCYVDTAAGRYMVTTVNADTVRIGPAPGSALADQLNGLRLRA
ncbi:ESX secretion-associated protein EspG [Actinophytocola sp.]|uniref:ESX secretion-associated protein EspG n=1 Tax=Actinophytocola sp. TaxID=1872138 RepID=UPI002ECFF242